MACRSHLPNEIESWERECVRLGRPFHAYDSPSGHASRRKGSIEDRSSDRAFRRPVVGHYRRRVEE